MAARLRFSPAPTGSLHVGHARTALFNWLYARHLGGTFILRIEDTDPARSRDEYVDAVVRGLHWLGLDWDEGPIRQSHRMDVYRGAAERLVASDDAYYCDCTRDAIAERTKGSGTTTYDRFCRDRNLGPGPGRALRFAVPQTGETVVRDLIRGDVKFAHDTIEDFVIVRGDGSPTFLLANAVDDMEMDVTHVIRGEDLLPSTPRALLLREALGGGGGAGAGAVPVFAHLPMIVDERRQKLSSRHGAVSVEEYREKGYLPEAMRNYLALLGWSPRDGQEVVPLDQMVGEFRLEDVNPSPAFFDVQKLDHVNAEYIRSLPVETFVRESLPWVESSPPWPPERFDLAKFEAMAPHVQERVRTLAEVPGTVDFIFLEEPVVDQASWDKAMRDPLARAVLDGAIEGYGSSVWEAEPLHEVTRALAKAHGLKLGKAQAPIRVAVTGRAVGPPLFESLQVLGREETLDRLRRARSQLGEP